MTDEKSEETAEELRDRLGLEQLTAHVGQRLGAVLKESAPDLGFCLLMFDYGERGNLAYVSSARRADVIKTLDEVRKMLVDDMEKA